MISVLILTKNEELDLPGCLDSVSWSDDIYVFDSMSTDRTAEIATSASAKSQGVHFIQRDFNGYAAQRNAALDLPFRHEWIFILDADERPSPELSSEIQRVVAAAVSPGVNAYRLRRRDFLAGTWLKHAQISPWYIRLVRRGKARYTREINEVMEVEGDIADLKSPLDHFPFSKGLAPWIARHNVYSTMEAQVIVEGSSRARPSTFALWRQALFNSDFHQRRIAQKTIFYQLPARPWIKWLYMMFVRGAILDGAAGITYANLHAFYEYMIVLKTRDLTRKSKQD